MRSRNPGSDRAIGTPHPARDESPPRDSYKAGTSTTSWGKAHGKLTKASQRVNRKSPLILAQTQGVEREKFSSPGFKKGIRQHSVRKIIIARDVAIDSRS